MKGKFITLEGPDGSGKSTQAALLTQYLADQGVAVISTREPGGTEIAEKIRTILLDPGNGVLNDRAEVFLYAASRAQHVEELIAPALNEGKMVICDRFVDSTLAYQGFGRGLDLTFLNKVNEMAAGGIMPDLTIVFDVTTEVAFSRIKNSRKSGGDRLEQESCSFHHRVRQGYLKLANKFPQRIKVVSGEKTVTEVFQDVKGYVDHLILHKL